MENNLKQFISALNKRLGVEITVNHEQPLAEGVILPTEGVNYMLYVNKQRTGVFINPEIMQLSEDNLDEFVNIVAQHVESADHIKY